MAEITIQLITKEQYPSVVDVWALAHVRVTIGDIVTIGGIRLLEDMTVEYPAAPDGRGYVFFHGDVTDEITTAILTKYEQVCEVNDD